MTATHPMAKRSGDAYAQLKEDILSNVLEPGFTATEPEIAARLGMSRTPVREALIRLQADGLIDVQPRRGMTVTPIHAEDMREIYEILGALEANAAAALALRENREDGALAPLEAAVKGMQKAMRDKDREAWAAADSRFHAALMAAHGNARMIALAANLLELSHRARLVTLPHRDLPLRSTAEQAMIFKAIELGDADAARAEVLAHRAYAAEELLPLIEAHGGSGGA